jgi:class 3 adenylate cyclase
MRPPTLKVSSVSEPAPYDTVADPKPAPGHGGSTAALDAIERAERAGYRLLLIARSIVLSLVLAWLLYGFALSGNPVGPTAAAASLLLGIAELSSVGTRHERRWRRYGLVVLDVASIASAAVFVPLLEGQDVPQHFVFRAYGFEALWLVIVMTTLVLQPRLTVVAALLAACAVGAVYFAVSWPMMRILSWSDLPQGATAADYINLLLSPDFIGAGNRIQEAAAMCLGGGVLAYAVQRARRVVFALAEADDRRRRIERAFGQHVPDWVVRHLIDDPASLTPSVHEASVLFMDVENFTAFSAGRDPLQVMTRLDALLNATSSLVARRGGIVVSYGGDSMLAVFGGPGAPADHADRGFLTARDILAGHDKHPLRLRIGLATGEVASGIVGGTARRSFTFYGETVNLAQRLEQACKITGTRLLMSAETYAALRSADLRHSLLPIEIPATASAPKRHLWTLRGATA